jgi:hypothetical protein
MKRGFILAVVAGALVVASVATAAPSPTPPTILDGQKYCPLGPLVVNVTQLVTGDVDRGVDGHVWAIDSYSRILQVTSLGGNLYCAGTRYSGQFVTVGGASPNDTGYVSPGVTGSVNGGFKSTVFHAQFKPTVLTSGVIGPYNYQCDLSGSCPGYVDWISLYFQNVTGYGWDRWQFTYPTLVNGGWSNSFLGNWGNITG